MTSILALDQGTTSSRAILFSSEGAVLAVAQKEFKQYYPNPGWVEHEPAEIWATQLAVAREVLNRTDIVRQDIAAVGIANQRETTLIWDKKTGEPVYNAIVWQDRRTAEFCESLKAGPLEKLIRDKTGLIPDPYFSASKIRWILENVSAAKSRAAKGELAFGTVDSWLAYQLSDRRLHITDASNASRTMLFNIHTGEWDEELLSIFGIPPSMLPEVRNSSEIYGATTLGIPGLSIPVAGIAGDQQAALFGQLCHKPGMVKSTYGTGCFVMMNVGSRSPAPESGLLTTIAWKLDNRTEYALEGSIYIGGAVVQWLRDELGLIHSASEIEALAQSVEDNGGVYLVPAFTGLGAPYWDPYARGTISGLSRGSNKGHIARAALEGIAHQVADILEVMQRGAGMPIDQIRVDGGACVNNLLMQLQADISATPTLRPRITETTALGAAYLAGLATGVFKDRNDIQSHWAIDRRFEPAMQKAERQVLRSQWAEAVQRSLSRIPHAG
ncbi:MAG: glycerol kinase GlpK [Methylococcaceae bacterium]|nr:glycerol kinase GlpK [Methylococcaceae bacterium]MCI0733621.1 glycerol kinase GlpK [Methylococcaceae bacterium]